MELLFHLRTLTVDVAWEWICNGTRTLMGIQLIIHDAKVFLVELKIQLRGTLR